MAALTQLDLLGRKGSKVSVTVANHPTHKQLIIQLECKL